MHPFLTAWRWLGGQTIDRPGTAIMEKSNVKMGATVFFLGIDLSPIARSKCKLEAHVLSRIQGINKISPVKNGNVLDTLDVGRNWRRIYRAKKARLKSGNWARSGFRIKLSLPHRDNNRVEGGQAVFPDIWIVWLKAPVEKWGERGERMSYLFDQLRFCSFSLSFSEFNHSFLHA